MAKIKESPLQVKPIVIRKKTVKGLFFMDQSTPSHYQYTIMKEHDGNLNMLCKTYAWEKKMLLPGMDPVLTPIKTSFKEIKCQACGEKISAIMLGESEIGHICMWCIESMNEPIEFEPLKDIEKYIDKSCTA